MTPAVNRLLDLAIEEDLGRGDATSAAVIDGEPDALGEIVAKERLVLAGLGLVEAVFGRVDWRARVRRKAADGDVVESGTVVAEVRGPAPSLLAGERVALNFLQRLSGIATMTAAFVRAADAARVRMADTRKTTPGWRPLERYAVRVGGGANHRPDLGSGILIKDNHVALAGGVTEAVRRARARATHAFRVEVEVTNTAELDQALEAGADVILLDNFTARDVAEAVKRVGKRTGSGPRPLIEASGGVTLERVRELARTGVDIISAGALTHSVRSVDLSMESRLVERDR